MPKENYSEKEVAKIFKRAAELESKQSQEFESIDGAPGLNLDELSQIAIDAGLDPENVRRAAGELSGDPQLNNSISTVKDNEVIAEQWVDGDFTDDLADLVIADLNHRYNATHEKVNWMDNIMNDASLDTDQQSKVKRTGKSFEWQKLSEMGTEDIRVLIQPRDDKIRIRVAKKNIYGTSFGNTDSITGFLPYIPFIAAFVTLFALPINYFVNSIVAVAVFFGTKILISKNSDWIKKKFSDSKSNTEEKYRTEVESVARDLAGLIGQPQKKSQAEAASEKETSSASLGDIEIEDAENETDRESNSARSRNRDRS
ncbi:hypothetical protein [Rhodohalobacter sp. 8-1]|uniref:hypothetical protein n=1 Tax=Rhodohalobacter sp. 8-1 TaxID=3131972 RepID=UPI0030EE43C0